MKAEDGRRAMPHSRMCVYMLLAGWIGALSATGWQNFTEARWLVLVVSVALMVIAGAALVTMGRADYRRGRIVDDRSGRRS